jgi:L-lactate dehydrogenase complex protein LldG
MGLRAYGIIGSSPRLFHFAQALGSVGTRIVSPLSQWFRVPAFTGWGYSKDFPRISPQSFRSQFKSRAGENASPAHQPDDRAEIPEAAEQQESLTERFCRELQTLGGKVKTVPRADLNRAVLEFLNERSVSEVAAWSEIDGLDFAWLSQHGISAAHEPNPALKVGITGAAAAIADTGTLLVTSGGGRPLTASLLGETHLAIVSAARIVPALEDALRGNIVPDAAAAVLITGPSRTADIEMALTIGVHGPKEIAVFVVE